MNQKNFSTMAALALPVALCLALSGSAAQACKSDYCANSKAPTNINDVGGVQDYLAAPANPPGFPGPDEGCQLHSGSAITAAVQQAKDNLTAAGADLSGACGAESILAAATQIMGGGAGCYSKTYGNNCNGVSVDLMCFADGYCYDVLSDAGGANGPGCSSTYVGPDPNNGGNGTDTSRYQAGCP